MQKITSLRVVGRKKLSWHRPACVSRPEYDRNETGLTNFLIPSISSCIGKIQSPFLVCHPFPFKERNFASFTYRMPFDTTFKFIRNVGAGLQDQALPALKWLMPLMTLRVPIRRCRDEQRLERQMNFPCRTNLNFKWSATPVPVLSLD